MTITSDLFKSQIHALLQDVGLSQCEVIVTESVQDWAKSVGIQENNPYRAGMAVTRSGDGAPAMALRRELTPEIRASVINALQIRGFEEDVCRIEDPLLFLEHLVLHEVAHLLLRDPSESDCDRWAFSQLSGRFAAIAS